MDFGGLRDFKAWLDDLFDHTLLINEDDPEMEFFKEMERKELCKLRVLPNIGMEGSSKYIFDYLDKWLKEKTNGRVNCYSVECKENDKNSAIYYRDDSSDYA